MSLTIATYRGSRRWMRWIGLRTLKRLSPNRDNSTDEPWHARHPGQHVRIPMDAPGLHRKRPCAETATGSGVLEADASVIVTPPPISSDAMQDTQEPTRFNDEHRLAVSLPTPPAKRSRSDHLSGYSPPQPIILDSPALADSNSQSPIPSPLPSFASTATFPYQSAALSPQHTYTPGGLAFKSGDTVTVLGDNGRGLLQGEVNGKRGLLSRLKLVDTAEIQSAAERGIAEAQYEFGIRLAFGTGGLTQDKLLGYQWHAKAADLGHCEAQVYVARCNELGLDIPQSRDVAVRWYLLAANERNHPVAQHRLGVIYGDGLGCPVDYSKAVEWFRKAATFGYPPSQDALGRCLMSGLGVAVDEVEAVKWFMRAARQGEASAMFHASMCFFEGKGVARNTERDIFFLRQAALRNHVPAMIRLATRLERADGLEKNSPEAFQLLLRAAERGNLKAHVYVGKCFSSGKGVTQSDEQAVQWFRKAADKGDPDAQLKLGLMIESGRGAERDAVVAFEWFHKAAMQGSAHAQNELGRCYELGIGVAIDAPLAAFWYQGAADKGNLRAQHNLATCCWRGFGMPADTARAVTFFQLAADRGHTGSQYQLAWYNEHRLANTDEALYLYTTAASLGHSRARLAAQRLINGGPSTMKIP